MALNVAEASVKLTADTRELTAGLSRAAKDAKAKGSEIAKGFKDSSREKLSEVFGGGSAVGLGLKAGAAGIGVAIAADLGKKLFEVATKAREFRREMEAAQDASRKFTAELLEGADRATASLADMGEFLTVGSLDKNLANLNEKLKEQGEQLEYNRKQGEEYDSKWNSWHNGSLWIRGQLEDTKKLSEAQAANNKQAMEAIEQRIKAARRQRAEWADPMTNGKAVTALRTFIRDQQEAVEQIRLGENAMNAEEQALLKLKRQFNFKEGDLGGARAALNAAVNARKLAEANKEATDWQRDLNNELAEQAGLAKDTAQWVRLEELTKKGADTAAIARIRDQIRAKQALNRQYQSVQALERGTSAEAEFRRKAEFDDKKRDEAAKIIGKQHLDWLKKIALGVDRLNEEPK